MDWYLPIGNKMPNIDALKVLGNTFQTNLIEASSAYSMAWETRSADAKLELIGVMKYHLTNCNMCIGSLFRFSSQKGQTVRVISDTQYATYLEKIKDLKSDIGRYGKSTASKASND